MIRCPVCKAENSQGPTCRRCKADLSLLFRLEGPYFAIGSWVAAEALRLICAQFKSLGGGTGMSIPPSELSQMTGLKAVQALFGLRAGAARDILIYWLALLLVVLVTLSIYAFVRSRMGLALVASRDNALAARSGVPPRVVLVSSL